MLLYKNLPNFKNNNDKRSKLNNEIDVNNNNYLLLVNKQYFQDNRFQLNDFDTNTRKKNVPYALLGKKRDK